MRTLIRRIETRYVLRYNTVMGYPEYRPNHTWPTPWQPVTDEVINTFTTDLMLSGLNVWDRDVRRYVFSTRIRAYNPIEDYLWHCHGKWDGRDRIRALAATVPTDMPELWAEWFHTWFLAMVAQWQGRNRRYGNAIVPLLISGQGMRKSTFCRSLLPPELCAWGYTDNLSLEEERKVHLAMSQLLLINLDEFNRISPQKQAGLLKNLVQLPSVRILRPYARHAEYAPRMASFIATTNMSQALSDPTGSRRFIGVQLTGCIRLPRHINYEQLYAQAVDELERGTRYWFTEAETQRIMEHNRRYQLPTDAEAYFLEHFRVPADGQEGQWLSAAAIIEHLKACARAAFQPPTVARMGRILAHIPGLTHRHTHHGECYLVTTAPA
mgnify:CR=1 FL=1